MSTKFALRICYQGTHYCGWQKQSQDPLKRSKEQSVQEVIEAALSKMLSEKTPIVGSGRTDSGVHALSQVAHFYCRQAKFTREILQSGLNSLLPEDIRIMAVNEVTDDFHAQKSAVKKQYSYYFLQGPSQLPHLSENSWWIRKTLNIEAMQTALDFLKGEHDFKSFQASGSKPDMSTVRKILEAEVTSEKMPIFPGQDLDAMGYLMVRVRIVGTGFLKQMVRGIAGTLLQVGENRRNAAEMKVILDSKNRSLVGPTAPAKGLTLERVWYKPDLYGNPN